MDANKLGVDFKPANVLQEPRPSEGHSREQGFSWTGDQHTGGSLWPRLLVQVGATARKN